MIDRTHLSHTGRWCVGGGERWWTRLLQRSKFSFVWFSLGNETGKAIRIFVCFAGHEIADCEMNMKDPSLANVLPKSTVWMCEMSWETLVFHSLNICLSYSRFLKKESSNFFFLNCRLECLAGSNIDFNYTRRCSRLPPVGSVCGCKSLDSKGKNKWKKNSDPTNYLSLFKEL